MTYNEKNALNNIRTCHYSVLFTQQQKSEFLS